jgi:cellulose synthase/poly-beta-1,6-N-acetylglucosamine synthase-like glycosyltransferase
MTSLAAILAFLCGGVCLIWLGRHREISHARRHNPRLTPWDAGPPAAQRPLVSLLVAGKDEAENIGACVRSLLEQDYDKLEVFVIDDRSSDGTAELARQAGDEDDRLRVLEVRELPPGWAGKNNAMAHGVAQASGQWLCMTDADCRFVSPAAVRVALGYALANNVDFLSVLPNLEMHGFWENVMQPVCSGVMIIWFNPAKVNDPARPHAYANGAFMLIRRSAFESIGGHEAVKDRLMEDLAMAQRVKRSGGVLRVVQGDGLVSVRMYTSLAKIMNGWSRIFFATFGTKRRLGVSLGVLLMMGLLPYVTAAAGWTAWATGSGTPWLAAAIAGTAAALAQISVIYRFYLLAGACAALCWTYPLGCIMAVLAIFKSFGKHRRGAAVNWRGTAYAGTKQHS